MSVDGQRPFLVVFEKAVDARGCEDAAHNAGPFAETTGRVAFVEFRALRDPVLHQSEAGPDQVRAVLGQPLRQIWYFEVALRAQGGLVGFGDEPHMSRAGAAPELAAQL